MGGVRGWVLVEINHMLLSISLLVIEGDAEIIEVEGDDMFLTDVFMPLFVKFSSNYERERAIEN